MLLLVVVAVAIVVCNGMVVRGEVLTLGLIVIGLNIFYSKEMDWAWHTKQNNFLQSTALSHTHSHMLMLS